jgi:hypothetical protein
MQHSWKGESHANNETSLPNGKFDRSGCDVIGSRNKAAERLGTPPGDREQPLTNFTLDRCVLAARKSAR